MRILVSNDDGVLAPGIQALRQAMLQHGEVEVMAPDRNRSGASNSLTLLRPLRVSKIDNESHCVDGTPTDCVHLALTGYFEQPFDLVVSGINEGSNLGDDVLYSGTVAAAMEGANMGIPSIAVSLASRKSVHYDTAARVASQLIQQLKGQQLPAATILNVNVPDIPFNNIKGMQITRLGTRHNARGTQQLIDPREQPIFWIGLPGDHNDAGPGTDFFAIQNGFVSITPLHLDMTHYAIIDQVTSWIDGISLQ